MENTALIEELKSNNLIVVSLTALENFTRDAIRESESKMRVWIDTKETCRLLNTNRQSLVKLIEQSYCKIEFEKANTGKTAKKRYRLDSVLAERNRQQGQ